LRAPDDTGPTDGNQAIGSGIVPAPNSPRMLKK